jgi:hypothetical protein
MLRLWLLLAFLGLPCLPAHAQSEHVSFQDDHAAIRTAVLDYVEGLYTTDTTRIYRSVHPDLAKRGYYLPRNADAYQNEPMSFAELIEVTRTWNRNGAVNPETALKDIVVFDVLDQTASAKLTAHWGIDYLQLARYDDRWMIVNVLWQTPPRPADHPPASPQVFARGRMELGHIYRGTFTPDGNTFYFFRKVTEGQEDYRIFSSHRTEAGWNRPEQVSLTGDFSDLYPTISPDGQRMVFTSYRPAPGDTARYRNGHLWYADHQGDTWGTPVFMSNANTLRHYHSGPYFGPDGCVYFQRTTPDWATTTDHKTCWNGQAFGLPAPVPEVSRWTGWRPELNRYVWQGKFTSDGSALLFVVSRRNPETQRLGPPDLWAAFRQPDGSWTIPRPLGLGINTDDGAENFAFSTHDTLFFTRNYQRFYHVSLSAALDSAR